MPRVSKERLVVVPFGAPEELNVYINGTRYDEFNTIKGIKKLNQQSFLEIELEDVTDTDTNVKKGNIILVFTNNKLFQKYTITHVNNMSDGVTKVIGEGSGEYSLRTKTVTRDVENESKFTDSTSANVVTQTCSGVINVGTNTELGNITVRADYDNKLRLLSNTSKTLNGDWWFDQTENVAYTTDQFNVSDFRGSQTSVFTLNQSGNDQNMVESSREQDFDNLWNDVRVLGYGEGVHQITSRCFHATLKRTTLSADINSSVTTINFVDGSQFSSGDIIWIGMEKVTLTIVAGNQATGCTRGVTGNGAIDAYAHKSGISCYLYTSGATTYDEDNPESGSSIEDNDINQKVIQDKTIIDQNALDFAAQKILEDHKDLVVRITCTVNDLYDFLDSADIGDTVTLNDTDAGLSSSEYRVVGYELISDDDWEDLNIEISNGYTNLVEEIKGTQVDTDNLSRYMQGAPNVLSVQSYENCDTSKPLKMKFRIWDKTISIQDARLDFNSTKYRAYTTTTTSGGGDTSGNSDIGFGWNGGLIQATPGLTWTNPYYTVAVVGTPYGTFKGVSAIGQIFNGEGATLSFPVTFQNTTTVVTWYTDTWSLTNNTSLHTGTLTKTTADVTVGDNLKFSTTQDFDDANTTSQLRIDAYANVSHTHSTPNHTHTMGYAIQEYTGGAETSVKVYIGLDTDASYDSNKVLIGTYSPDNDDIEFTTELKDLVGNLTSTKIIRLQFEPQNTLTRIEANADIFVHLSSD